ncbi:MAG: methylated-DNA--[protein]-cysteine S-methyltransferase [Sulfobacillus sp.]|nr:methylated-DNA--[protein]-cysteine S-methyltransferase [Sulfobacillus sp.]
MSAIVYWNRWQQHPWGSFYLAATSQGLIRLLLPHESLDDLAAWASRYLPGASFVEDPVVLTPYRKALDHYFTERTLPTVPVVWYGTPFQKAVWQALTRIPQGQTVSYRHIAEAVGHPHALRAVGTAVGANPIPILVPCHRVIRHNGTLGQYAGGQALKARLLAWEGVSGPWSNDFTSPSFASSVDDPGFQTWP